MSRAIRTTLVDAWARGELPLRDVLGVPAEAIAAARTLGERCIVLGDAARAEIVFAGLAALDPADGAAAASLATLALERGAPDIALAWAERTLGVGPGDPNLRSLAARARRALELRTRERAEPVEPETQTAARRSS